MTGQDNTTISDDRLVAYIDGALSPDDRAAVAHALEHNPQISERLALLDSGGRPFALAFDLLLEAAPDARLQAMFAGLTDRHTERPAQEREQELEDNTVLPFRRPQFPGAGMQPIWRMAAAASLALTVFGGGVITGALVNREQARTVTQGPDQATRNWMDAAAQYVSLFTDQTLAGMPADSPSRDAGLRRVSAALGLPLSHEKLAMPSLAFRGTQLLQLEGKPLAQIAFMSESGKPVAICITRTPRAPEPPAPDRKQGLNLVHWIANGYGFMVIGDMPPDALQRISQDVMARLS